MYNNNLISDNNLKLKNLKLYLLQTKYKLIANIILNLNNQIIFLESNYLIDINEKNTYLGQLYELNKNLNSSNNNYLVNIINYKINIEDELELILPNKFNSKIIKSLEPFIKIIEDKYMPFYEEEVKLKELIKNIGFPNLIKLLKFMKYTCYSEDVISIITKPKNKPKDCDTPVTASDLYFFVNFPPKKSAVTHRSDENKARNEAIK